MGIEYFLQQLVNGICLGGMYALMSVGYSLVYSIMNFSNFAHGGVIMVGAYVGYFALTSLNVPFFPAFLLWCAAVEKAGSDDPQAIADAYSQVEVEGMAGKIKISAEDHNPVGKSGCVERIDGKNKTYVFETYIAAD